VESDVAAAGIGFTALVRHKLGDDAEYGSFEFEKAPLVKDHRHGGGGDGFGNGGQVEESGGTNAKFPILGRLVTRGSFFVRETAEGLECDETIAVRDGDGGRWKCSVGNGFRQNCEGGKKGLVLIVESRDESWKRMVQGLYAREKIRDLSGL